MASRRQTYSLFDYDEDNTCYWPLYPKDTEDGEDKI